MVAKAEAEVGVQTARIEQVKRQLEADVIAPAQAEMLAAINDARGRAAKIVEEGKATANVLSQTTRAWKQAGSNAKDVFLMQKLDSLVKTITDTVVGVKVDKITVLGVGNSNGDLASKVISANEQLKSALGVDLVSAIQNRIGLQAEAPKIAPIPVSR